MANTHSHLTLSDRIHIEQALECRMKFKDIAVFIGKDPTTVSKEIRRHRIAKESGRKTALCENRSTCTKQHMCHQSYCNKLCGKCTLHYCHSYCEDYSAPNVCEIFETMESVLGTEKMCELFEVLLTDNGPEFKNPSLLERNLPGQRRTHIFYCDPMASWQKGRLEGVVVLNDLIIDKANFRRILRFCCTFLSSTRQKSSLKWTSSNQCIDSTDHSIRA